ncbi:MAG TPA: efflux RND transporter permease subunit [Tepidisphaeraceae bacterium]|jgi:multidrug efflux pump subunit AcrB|nr:efflux RND transporter permease subunit [Tepidisphaeraceae bacterium]
MWIVRLALRRPYTFVVAAMLVFILGVLTILRMPTDIFPEINIPVIAVAFNYSGMTPSDMESRIVTPYERILPTIVSGIEHTESQSLNGIAVIKIFFHENADIHEAMAQVTSISQTVLKALPPGTQAPLIIQYSASDVPIIQLAMSSDRMPEEDIFDVANTIVRINLASVQGAQMPWPYGGKAKQVMVDIDPQRLYAWGISPSEVVNAISAQNLILPAGSAKFGVNEMPIMLNASPGVIDELNNLPIKTVNGVPVYIKDVAHVRDGFQVQQSIVHADGKRGVLQVILKAGGASTLDVVKRLRAALPAIEALCPPSLKITPLFDQSIFVRASVSGVEREAAIAAGLTALMILIFLGSWRSTLIVVISIPLSILVSIIVMSWLGQTLNVMTLGGLALAVGILVDDATVEIENIHRNLGQKKRLVQAILDGASQIAVPAFVSTLCICIVFVPVLFISGAAKFLFVPLAMAVVFAMLTSYLLSRTLVPTMVHYLLASEVEIYGGKLDPSDPHADRHKAEELDPHKKHPHVSLASSIFWVATRIGTVVLGLVVLLGIIALLPLKVFPDGVGASLASWHQHPLEQLKSAAWGWDIFYLLVALFAIVLLHYILQNNLIWRFHEKFNAQFEKLRDYYGGLLALALEHRMATIFGFTAMVLVSCCLTFLIGTDFFPAVDAGQIRLHVRNPPGTRIEQSERIFGNVERAIRKDIPASEIDTLMDNMGIPNSSINLSLSDGSLMSPADGEILISLNPDHRPTIDYIDRLNADLPKRFPAQTFYFQPADIVTQVLNFGIAAPIDVQIDGPQQNEPKNLRIAEGILKKVRAIPGAADVRLEQVPDAPDVHVNVDRTLASEVGVTQQQVANDLLVSLSGTAQLSPNFWINPTTGIQYNVLVQTPQYKMNSISDLTNTPIVPPGAGETQALVQQTQLLGNLASVVPGRSPSNITHYQVRPTYDILAGVRHMDLGTVAEGVNKIVADARKLLPRGSSIMIRGQVQSMHDSFEDMSFGLIFAIILVYLLMVINFQSWIDPMIILVALPGALAGILWMLFLTGTTLNVPSLMGAIMSIGVATSNSILLITFANDQRKEGYNAHDAALSAGMTRLRPVIMTALAMIIGMLPMSLGLGEGGEQNAPLGRAVIGGLLLATFATLFFVPVVYSKLREKAPQTQVEEELR